MLGRGGRFELTQIDKYPLDRLRSRGIRLSFDCPYCQGARIELKDARDLNPMEGVRCFKCKALIVLDSLTLTVIREPPAPAAEGS